jgi:hypothetical protein
MFCPATESARFQTAICVPVAQPGAFVFGGATTTLPDSGSGMFASRAKIEPLVVPIVVPGAAEALIVYPVGT